MILFFQMHRPLSDLFILTNPCPLTTLSLRSFFERKDKSVELMSGQIVIPDEVIFRVTRRIFESYVLKYYNILYNNWANELQIWKLTSLFNIVNVFNRPPFGLDNPRRTLFSYGKETVQHRFMREYSSQLIFHSSRESSDIFRKHKDYN